MWCSARLPRAPAKPRPRCWHDSPAARKQASIPRIYEATPGALIEVLEEHADADCVLLVGHNPGLETLVSLLTDGTSDQGRGMPPGSIAWMHVDGDASIEPGAASLRHFWWP
jgi:phosphohistidine phosphatase